MEYIKTYSYHCHNCGAVHDIRDEKCKFCGSKLSFRTPFFLNNMQNPFRTFIKQKDGTKIYLHEAISFSQTRESEQIECTMLEDSTRRFMTGLGYNSNELSIEANLTRNLIDKIEYINSKGSINICIENDLIENDIVISTGKLKPSMPQFTECSIATVELICGVDDLSYENKENDYVKENSLCPNCGAVLHKKYGLCDYCGGWVMDMNCYV